MRTTSRRVSFSMTAWIAATVFCLGAAPARAQFGVGMGMGMGGGLGFGLYGGGFVPYIQQPSNYLNQLSVSRAPAALMVKTFESNAQRHPYANNPNAYINHVRDNGFVDQYSMYRGAPVYFQRGMAAPPQPHRRPRTVVTGAQTRPVAALKSFYDDNDALVWPADAPDAPDLKEKRAIFDRASQAVFREMKAEGVASIAAVTDARQKLLDYGRPALKHVRAHETARIADGFHKFLLDLYDSLAQAAIPTVAAAPVPAAPASAPTTVPETSPAPAPAPAQTPATAGANAPSGP